MPVNSDDIRGLASRQFMTQGLGGKLTHGASVMIQSFQSAADEFAAALACGNIIERIAWVELGQWLGYLRDIPLLSDKEIDFLRDNQTISDTDGWSDQFAQMMSFTLIVGPEVEAGGFFFPDRLGSQLPKDTPELFSLFQASHVVAECLMEYPITRFFIFLRNGKVEELAKDLSLDKIFTSLEDYDYYTAPLDDSGSPETVVAGFIRYTEYLSAMDSLFPRIPPDADQAVTIPSKVLQRERLANEIKEIIQWRFPRNEKARERFEAARDAFLKIASGQFERYPESGVQWSAISTAANIDYLSQRFFGVEASRVSKEQGASALEERAREIAAENQARLKEIIRRQEASGAKFSVQENLKKKAEEE